MSKTNKEKKYPLTVFITVLIVFLALVQLFISHRLATVGESVRESEQKAAQLEQENIFLEEEISQMGSLNKLSQRAEELGFARTSEILYLTPQIPVAMNH